MNSSTRVLLVLACLLSGPPTVLADELPADTNAIESLTVEQARKLAEEFPGVWVEYRPWNSELEGCLPLNGLKTLDPDVAQALAGYDKGPIYLNGLTTLDVDTAKALAEFKCPWLFIDGLTSLDAGAAKAIAEFRGVMLGLDGLTTLDSDTQKALAECRCNWLMLNGLTTLDADTAKVLAKFKGILLSFNGLTTLDAAAAEAIAEATIPWLGFDGLTTLDSDTAKVIAECRCNWLDLNGLTTLDADTAKVLADFKCVKLFLLGLTTLDADTARMLAGHGGVELSEDVLKEFIAQHPWSIDTALTHAALLGGNLQHVTAFEFRDSVTLAKALAARKGRLAFPNLKKISPKALEALLEKEDVEIPAIETLTMIPEPDGSITDDFVIPKSLRDRERKQR